jgi:hypothetical protein
MSSSQLRRKAVLAVQLENFWNAGVIRLVEAPRHYPLVALVLQVQIIPGGDLILILCSDGNMHLHRWRDVSAVPLVTETVPSGTVTVPNTSVEMRVSFSSSGQPWVAIINDYKIPGWVRI